MNQIDSFLNSITMYRLVLYYLLGLLGIATILSFLGVLAYNPWAIVGSTIFLLIISMATNVLFARVFEAATNVESVYITALILALIINPITSGSDLIFLGWAAIWAMASKYIFAIGKKHLFNPAALAVVITNFMINQSASWWVGTLSMLPYVFAGGVLIARKIRRFDLVASFLGVAIITSLTFGIFNNGNLFIILQKALIESPLFFFAFIMLTEPLTTPPTRFLQTLYGALVGFLFAPQTHLGSLYTTPELALIIGNVFSYLTSPKQKLILRLKDKIKIASDMYDFVFTWAKPFAFTPGQYLEWTLPHEHPDDRGNRRYFTIASSPTENEIRMGVKYYSQSSSYKKALLAMKQNSVIIASQLAGDFVLPKDKNKKLAFIAGGIGVTPFRSMTKYLLDKQEKRDIVVFYSTRQTSEIVYTDVLMDAQNRLDIKTVYTITDPSLVPRGWQGRTGRINQEMIVKEAPDWQERTFYISGPQSMVTATKELLLEMGLPGRQMITDYFPGF